MSAPMWRQFEEPYLLGLELDEAVHGEHVPQDYGYVFSRAVERAGKRIDSGEAGRLARVGYLASLKTRAGYGLRNDRMRRAA